MRQIRRFVFLVVIFLLMTACEGGPPAAVQETPILTVSLIPPTPTLFKPTPIPLVIDTGSASIQFGRLNFSLFKPGIVEEQSDDIFLMRNPDRTAWMRVYTDFTQYELEPDDFINYCENVIASLIADTQDLQHYEVTQDEEAVHIYSTFTYDGQAVRALNIFLKQEENNDCVYSFSFWTPETHWNSYYEVFEKIFKSRYFLKISPFEKTSSYQDYFVARHYTLPEGDFLMRIPIGWSPQENGNSSNNKIVESFFSPDGEMRMHAVQVSQSSYLTKQELHDFTIQVLEELVGENLDITSSGKSMDWKIRMDWNTTGGDWQGFSYYLTYEDYLYILSFQYTGEHESSKKELLAGIWDTFQFAQE